MGITTCTKRETILNIQEKCLGEKYTFIRNSSGRFRPIGEGGSGIVYAANQIFSSEANVHTKRAIKFFSFRDDLVGQWGYVSKDNFDVEIKNISRFNHQNILKVIDGNYYPISVDGQNINIPYTVTEFVEGPDLQMLFEEQNRNLCAQIFKDEETVFDLFSQILNGLIYLHKNNFYHCDIAPKNIFIKTDADGEFLAIIGDLGAGKTVNPRNFDRTRIIGTWKYMPNSVQSLKNQEVSYSEFCKLQPYWDIYSTVQSLKEIIRNIKNSKLFKFDFWNLDRLFEKLEEESYASLSDISNDISHLRPTSNQIFRLDELSEASKSIGQVLLPINSVYLSRRMRKLSKHDMLLRLMDVPQLLECATTFPGANHTRYEHTLGTYELMRKAMLALLRNKEYAKFFSEKYVIIGLLAALLSSLIYFPYAHAIMELQNQQNNLYSNILPREMFRKLINKKSAVSNKSLFECITELFGEYKIDLADIEYVIFGKESNCSRNEELEVLYYILNSSVGVRVLDYMMRDSHHIGLTYKIDTDALFKSMSIFKREFCLKQHGITSAEQIIANRYWLFKRIYWSDPNRSNTALLKYILYIAHNETFSQYLCDNYEILSKKDICTAALRNICDDQRTYLECAINQLKQKGQTRYKSVLVLDKKSSYPHANEICSNFAKLDYAQQNMLRDRLEIDLIKEFDISEVAAKYGPIILIDMPYEKPGNKLGEDIKIIRYDDTCLPLNVASGIIAGLKTSFDDQLMLLRIFVRPDVFDNLNSKFGGVAVANLLSKKLYDLL